MPLHESDGLVTENDPPYSLLCSSCYTPCPAADAHVIPNWNPTVRRILTTYRCNNCWLTSLAELRSLVASGEVEVQMTLCDFLEKHGYSKDSETIRVAPPERREGYLLAVIGAVETGNLVLQP